MDVEMIQDMLDRNKEFRRNIGAYKVGSTTHSKIQFKEGKPQGLVLHSIGIAQPDPQRLVNGFNAYHEDKKFPVHAFLGPSEIVQCMPWGFMGAHAGGALNSTHLGVEMTEPNTATYSNSKWTYSQSDPTKEKTKDFIVKAYKTAVKLFAYLCKQYDIDPLGYVDSSATIKENGTIVPLKVRTITSHQEGNEFGRMFCEGKLVKCNGNYTYCTIVCAKYSSAGNMSDYCGTYLRNICKINPTACPHRRYICGEKIPHVCSHMGIKIAPPKTNESSCKAKTGGGFICSRVSGNNCIASNHADPFHMWYKIPMAEKTTSVAGKNTIYYECLTMAGFRHDVNEEKNKAEMYFVADTIPANKEVLIGNDLNAANIDYAGLTAANSIVKNMKKAGDKVGINDAEAYLDLVKIIDTTSGGMKIPTLGGESSKVYPVYERGYLAAHNNLENAFLAAVPDRIAAKNAAIAVRLVAKAVKATQYAVRAAQDAETAVKAAESAAAAVTEEAAASAEETALAAAAAAAAVKVLAAKTIAKKAEEFTAAAAAAAQNAASAAQKTAEQPAIAADDAGKAAADAAIAATAAAQAAADSAHAAARNTAAAAAEIAEAIVTTKAAADTAQNILEANTEYAAGPAAAAADAANNAAGAANNAADAAENAAEKAVEAAESLAEGRNKTAAETAAGTANTAAEAAKTAAAAAAAAADQKDAAAAAKATQEAAKGATDAASATTTAASKAAADIKAAATAAANEAKAAATATKAVVTAAEKAAKAADEAAKTVATASAAGETANAAASAAVQKVAEKAAAAASVAEKAAEAANLAVAAKEAAEEAAQKACIEAAQNAHLKTGKRYLVSSYNGASTYKFDPSKGKFLQVEHATKNLSPLEFEETGLASFGIQSDRFFEMHT
ncbi:MAG: peptidoglycan recognition protein family protein [Clostridiales bacterium]|nr:peptidoglycan recognition protein family protein [Clostridiales bacterium]